MAVADRCNEFIAAEAPWRRIGVGSAREDLRLILSTALMLFRAQAVALAPVLPDTAARVRAYFGEIQPWQAADLRVWLSPRALPPYQPLWTRIEPARIEAMIDKSRAPRTISEARCPVGKPG